MKSVVMTVFLPSMVILSRMAVVPSALVFWSYGSWRFLGYGRFLVMCKEVLVCQSILVCPTASQFQIGEILMGSSSLFALSVNQKMLIVTDELVGHLPESHVSDSICCRDEFCKRVFYLSDTGIGSRSPVYAYTVLRIFKQDVEHL